MGFLENLIIAFIGKIGVIFGKCTVKFSHFSSSDGNIGEFFEVYFLS